MSDVKIKIDSIKLVPTKDLKQNPKNRNHHPQDQIEEIARHYSVHGMRTPIIVSNQTKHIVSGNGRYLAALRAGLDQVPVSYQDFDSPKMEYAFGVADNGLSLWSELDMAGINNDLSDLGPDFNIDDLGIKDLTLDVSEKFADKDPDEIPEVVEPKAKLGEIYKLGNHRLMCGDSTDIATVEKLMNGEKADMVFTDPPYGMNVVKADGNIGGNRVGKNGYGNKGQYGKEAKCGVYKPIIGDDKPYDPSHLFKMSEIIIVWGANHFSDKLPTSPHWIVWNKEMPEGTDFSGAELAWTNIDKKAVKVYKFSWAGMTRQGNRKDELQKRVHPTQKPVGLFEMILNDYDPKSVIDVFGGSGSTLIACEKTNRKCFMMELDPHYIDIIIARWENFTGQKAELING